MWFHGAVKFKWYEVSDHGDFLQNMGKMPCDACATPLAQLLLRGFDVSNPVYAARYPLPEKAQTVQVVWAAF